MTIKAIETVYKGYRFRSRLEARWAVFFDEMGYDWEYESEGYELRDGTWYLPDFKIKNPSFVDVGHFVVSNDFHLWVEIKGQNPTDDEIQKCVLLQDGTRSPCLIICGDPLDNGWIFITGTENVDYGDIYSDYEIRDPLYIRRLPTKARVPLRLIFDDYTGFGMVMMGKCPVNFKTFYKEWNDTFYYENEYAKKVESAALKARQARFEHK